MIRTLGAPNGLMGPTLLSPDRGKSRNIAISVPASPSVPPVQPANPVAFFARTANELRAVNLGLQAGWPITPATPFLFQSWKGDLWGVGSVDGVIIDIEEL